MKWHLFAMLVSVVVSLIGLGLIITQTTPSSASAIIRLLFFAALMILLWGTSSLVTLYTRYRLGNVEVDDGVILGSYKLGFIVSLAILGIIAINIWIQTS